MQYERRAARGGDIMEHNSVCESVCVRATEGKGVGFTKRSAGGESVCVRLWRGLF